MRSGTLVVVMVLACLVGGCGSATKHTNLDLKAAITAAAGDVGSTDITGLSKLATLCPNATPTPTG